MMILFADQKTELARIQEIANRPDPEYIELPNFMIRFKVNRTVYFSTRIGASADVVIARIKEQYAMVRGKATTVTIISVEDIV
jgi:hypothetical protein